MPTTLLINDDGIGSVGLVALRRALKGLGEVLIVAPEKECSGIGKALTCDKYVRLFESRLADGTKAYAITGTPADAFLIASNKLLKRMPDLLVAGINLGPNLGVDDLLSSGTLGAALEAAAHGVPAMAISYCMEISADTDDKVVAPSELDLSAYISRRVAEYLLERGMPKGVDIISINVPYGASLDRVRVTQLSYRGYRDIHAEVEGRYRIPGWLLEFYPDDAPSTDVHAVKDEECISVTPIRLRLQHETDALRDIVRHII
jgi:5'-nucleotidase